MVRTTIHPTGDGDVEIRVDGREVAVLPDRDAAQLGQLLVDLFGLSATSPPDHGQVCGTCDGPIGYLPDGWRHLTAEPGPSHTAHPGQVSHGGVALPAAVVR